MNLVVGAAVLVMSAAFSWAAGDGGTESAAAGKFASLTQELQAGFATARVDVAGQSIDVTLFWFPEPEAERFQRPYDLWVPAAKMYAFIDPVRKLTSGEAGYKALRAAVLGRLESYLAARHADPVRVFTQDMLQEGVRQGDPPRSSENTDRPWTQVRLELKLLDGSRLIGIPAIKSVPVRTTYAKTTIGLDRIASIVMKGDHETGSIVLCNGDRLQGVVGLGTIGMEMLFGKVSVGMENVLELRVIPVVGGLPGTLAEGLALYLPFDRDEGDRASDRSGGGNHGVVQGATWVEKGRKGGGCRFADQKQIIRVQGLRELGRNYTLAAWVCFDNFDNPYPHIMSDPAYQFVFHGQGSAYRHGEQQRVAFYSGSDLSVRAYHMVSDVLPPATWHLLVVVVAGDKSFLYRDGQEVSRTESQTPREIRSMDGLDIGTISGPKSARGQQFCGTLDEVMVWTRALSAEEVKAVVEWQK